MLDEMSEEINDEQLNQLLGTHQLKSFINIERIFENNTNIYTLDENLRFFFSAVCHRKRTDVFELRNEHRIFKLTYINHKLCFTEKVIHNLYIC